MLVSLALLSLLVPALATPVRRQDANATTTASTSEPKVTINPFSETGGPVEITGTRYPSFGHDAYLGIPYANPVTRFAPPQDSVWNTSSFSATTMPPACPQPANANTRLYGVSEDCLFLNILTPQGANSETAFLPVMLWVHGGSFVNGAASIYNGTFLLGQGIQSDQPFVLVTINYRLGVFGFPQGDEALTNGAANLGLKDVIKSLEWVKANIWGFGGDPDRVTIFGESAGAILISLLYLNPEQNLFRSAIMESGAQSTAPIGPTATTWERPFDLVVQFAGCNASASAANGSAAGNATAYSSTFDCLANIPTERLLAAQEQVRNITQYAAAFVFSPSIDGDLIPASPHDLLAQGQFARIPFISGNNADEGTGFVPTGLPLDNAAIVGLALGTIEPIPPSQEVITQLLTEIYPPVPALGSPFGTGNATFGLSPGFKQLAAILGDAAFQANRRWFLQQANANGFDQTWSYLFEAYTPGAAPYLGSFHGSEIPYVFGVPQISGTGLSAASNGAPALLSGANYTALDAQLSKQMIAYWLNFAYYSDPTGGPTGANLTQWPTYQSDLNTLAMNITNVTVIKDDYRQEQMQFFLDRPQSFNYKRELGEVI